MVRLCRSRRPWLDATRGNDPPFTAVFFFGVKPQWNGYLRRANILALRETIFGDVQSQWGKWLRPNSQ